MTREIGNAVLSPLLNRTRTTLCYPEALRHGEGDGQKTLTFFCPAPTSLLSSLGNPEKEMLCICPLTTVQTLRQSAGYLDELIQKRDLFAIHSYN